MADRQEVYTLIDQLDERDLEKVAEYIARLHPAPEDAEQERRRSLEAFERLEKMRVKLSRRFPPDYDFDAARAEAVTEKYGRFD